MKKNRFFSLTTLTITSMYMYNKFINTKAKNLYPINHYSNFQYKWRYGNIYYTKHGKGSPLLFIHDISSGSSSFEWQYLISEFEKDYTVYALDLIGCGRSEKPCFTYTNFLFVQLINDFICDIIKEKCNVVTSGSASSIALMTALYKEDLTNKIIMINPISISTELQSVSKENYYKNKLFNFPIIGTFLANRLNTREVFENLFYDYYFNNPYKAENAYIDAYYSSYHNNHTSKSLFSSVYNNYTHTDISLPLKKVENQIYIIGGENEEHIYETMKEYTSLNHNIQTEVINNAKHLPQLEYPSEVISIIDNILNR